jgi:NAD(P)-dependent dehydrogenase (short-subunit alcohol dehydrogenase family)
MEVNLMAPYRITKKFIPLLVAHNRDNTVKARVVNIASWSGLMSAPYIGFYNASKFALIGLTESMFYDLRLLDIHTVLAIPGLTRTPLLAKTTGDLAATLSAMPEAGRARYQHLLDHYADLGARSASSSMLARPEQLARKLYRIVEKPKPRYKNYLGADASFIDNVMTRLPWAARVAMNTRMYRLDRRTPGTQVPPLPAAA